jgi:hypothetical protein
LQAGEILALDDDRIEIHVMSEASVARVTPAAPGKYPSWPMLPRRRDVRSFAELSGVDRLLRVNNLIYLMQSVESVREILEAIQRVRAVERTAGRASICTQRTSRRCLPGRQK